MEKNERRIAELLRDRMAKIITDLKLAYEDAKLLANKYNWDINYFDMCEAYMNLAHDFIYIMAMLEDDKKEARNELWKIETEEDEVPHLRRLLRGAEEEREALRGVQACDHARRKTRAVQN